MKRLTQEQMDKIEREADVMYDYRIAVGKEIHIYIKDGDLHEAILFIHHNGYYQCERENALGISGDFLENN